MADNNVQPPDISALGPSPASQQAVSDVVNAPVAQPTYSGPGDPTADLAKKMTSAVPAAPGNHQKLFGMLAGLGVALSAAGKAISTHGREGGAQDVAAYEEQQQAMGLREKSEQRAEKQQSMAEQESTSRMELQGAQTAAMQANTQATLSKLPAEIQQAHVTLMNSLAEMYTKAGYAPQVALAMAEGMTSGEFMGQVSQNTQGNIGQNSFMPKYDDKYGSGKGSVMIGSREKLAQIQLDKATLSPSLMQMDNTVEVAKTAGVDPALIAQAKSQLQHFETMPDGTRVNGAEYQDFVTTFENRIVNGIAAKQKETELQQKQQQLSNEVQTGKNEVATGKKLGLEIEKTGQEIQANKELLGSADAFGNKVGLPGDTPKDVKQKQGKFDKDYVQPLNVLQKTTMEFERINNNPNQTGAEKVTALLNAVGISGDPLKGKGFRISNDIINEHAQARNIWESGVQKLNTIAGSGGPITSKQIADYTAVAQGVVHDAYVTAAQEARRQGLPVNFLPRATAQGQAATHFTAKIYLDAAGGDLDAAHKAMVKAGYAE